MQQPFLQTVWRIQKSASAVATALQSVGQAAALPAATAVRVSRSAATDIGQIISSWSHNMSSSASVHARSCMRISHNVATAVRKVLHSLIGISVLAQSFLLNAYHSDIIVLHNWFEARHRTERLQFDDQPYSIYWMFKREDITSFPHTLSIMISLHITVCLSVITD